MKKEIEANNGRNTEKVKYIKKFYGKLQDEEYKVLLKTDIKRQ